MNEATNEDPKPPEEAIETSDDSTDATLDAIDAILEENAEEFVRGFVKRGGQGWSTFLDPSFYVGAAAAGIIAGATWDSFKKVIARVHQALSSAPGPALPLADEDDLLATAVEVTLEGAWRTAEDLVKQRNPQHSIDEAAALHWVLYSVELFHELNTIRLGPEQYTQIARIAAEDPERLTADQLVGRIVEQWIQDNNP
ncbi:ubiquitin-like protein Pup [Kitasatospora sp. NPDC059973]|uniref:ubiquitin-like protein Pup n=1 Tax=Kitasatospora sp. NPDC059973 TaxID=3347020 RepID=UPI00369F0EFB